LFLAKLPVPQLIFDPKRKNGDFAGILVEMSPLQRIIIDIISRPKHVDLTSST
jgi:hypothetical protein